MGIWFRKSKNVGPFRFNLSQRGLGVSAGPKGARIGRRAGGKYYAAGGKGVLNYRYNLGGSTKRKRRSTKGFRLSWLLLVALGGFLVWGYQQLQ
jgi:hypothetical protein